MGKYFFLILLFIVTGLAAKVVMEIPYATDPPEIDGIVENGEWDNAIFRDEFYQISPGDNTQPSERTEMFLTYDNINLYIMAKFYFNDKTRIRDFHCSRDKIYTTDRMFFFFDTFHSNDMAYYIGCNMHGEQADGIVLDEIDPSIDLFYISKAEITDYGFAVELMLPLESIKYKSGEDVEWGFFAKRHVPDGPEEISAFKVGRGGGNFYNNYSTIRFEHLPTKQNLTIIPSISSSYNIYENVKIDEKEEDSSFDPELNIFYEPNSNLMTTITINPDFNIIEADGLEVDINNRFPRFFQEKRPFFIEQSNPFYTDINIFHTRNIVDPSGGAKISGSFGKTSLYILGALDEKASGERFGYGSERENVPFIFASLGRKAADGNSFIRTAATFRKFSEYENYVFDIDGNKRFSDMLDADLQFSVSSNDVLEENGDSEVKIGYAYAGDMDIYNGTWFINNEIQGISEDFRADLGYVPDTDMNFFKNKLEYQIHSDTDRDVIRYMEFASTQNVKFTFDLKDVKSHYWEIMSGGIFSNTFEFWTGFEYLMESYEEKDKYTHNPWLNMSYEPIKFLKLGVFVKDGIALFYEDGKGETDDLFEFVTSVNFRPVSSVDIEFKQQYNEIEEKFIARTYEVIAKFQFHRNFWVRGILQIADMDLTYKDEEVRVIGLYPLFVYKPSSKASIYLGATRNDFKREAQSFIQIMDDEIDTTYFLKMSYTFDIL